MRRHARTHARATPAACQLVHLAHHAAVLGCMRTRLLLRHALAPHHIPRTPLARTTMPMPVRLRVALHPPHRVHNIVAPVAPVAQTVLLRMRHACILPLPACRVPSRQNKHGASVALLAIVHATCAHVYERACAMPSRMQVLSRCTLCLSIFPCSDPTMMCVCVKYGI
jgi:hypothetical protein